MTLEEHIKRHAALCHDKTAVVAPDARLSYGQLWQAVEERAARLRAEHGGRVVVVRSSQTAAFLVEYFAIHAAGKTAVPLEHDVPGAVAEGVRGQLAAIERNGTDAIPADVADILFTTGTTGKAKGVMISSATIVADAENLIDAQKYSSSLTFIVSGPLNHIGSLSKVYPVMCLGATLHVTEGMRDMNTFFSAIDAAEGKVATFLVPASIRMLMEFGEDAMRRRADKIDFIETGAAPMALADMQRLCALLPKSRLYNTYASTETGIVATFDFNAGECIAGCLGKPMRHSRIAISPDSHISCSGKTLMTGYVGDPHLTSSVLYDGSVHTADLGFFDSEGRLRLSGRDDDVINVGGYKVAPTEVEDAAMASPMVADCVCLPAQHPVLGTVLRLLVVLADGFCLDKRQLAFCIRGRLEAYKVPVYYGCVEQIRRTYNGKIDRKAYSND